MVVLSVAICTKTGKALLSRQFVEMTRIRIEGLLAAFPKLITTDAKQQHTYVETESVRYVYQSLDSMYLLLITNRASNIVEDLDTLRLLSKVVPSVIGVPGGISEEKLTEKRFELLFAFDEVITAGGYREPITLQQINTNLEMESHEEKLHNMIKQSKMEVARDQRMAAEKSIREKQREAAKNPFAGIGGGSPAQAGGYGGSDRGSDFGGPSSFTETPAASFTPPPTVSSSSRAAAPVKGMSLMAGGGKNKNFEDALMREDKLAPVLTSSKSAPAAVEAAPIVAQHPLMMVIAEKVSASLTRDGGVQNFDIKGSLTLTAATDAAALCSIQLKQSSAVSGFTFQTHPKINKAEYDKRALLQLKDTTKGFPSQRPVGVLKWSYSSTSDDLVPIKINCWPEEEAKGQMNVSIEYSVDNPAIELHDVRIVIPLGTSDTPRILHVDGVQRHSHAANEMVWEISLIDASNATGSLEFTIQQRNADAFFPIQVNFASQQLYCSMEVVSVRETNEGTPIMYGLSKSMSSEEYVIQ